MSFLTFRDLPNEGRATKRVAVLSKSRGDVLGLISWYGPWRQYVFEAHPGTIWSDGCLVDVNAKLTALRDEHRAGLAERRAVLA